MEAISKSDEISIRVASISAFVAHQLQVKDPYPFCRNPLDFVVCRSLFEYAPHADVFVEQIIQEGNGRQLIWESRTTKFGYQGSNDFFEIRSENVSFLENIVSKAVDEYHVKFSNEKNSFIKLWPGKYKIVGWYNRLIKNGYQKSHIHAGGWLSGVIYLKTIKSLDNEEGAIEFGLHGYDYPILDHGYPRKLHKPKQGDIVLFPSSLFHRTIPFTMDTERCVVAFDIIPA
jgi:hypothetical protein